VRRQRALHHCPIMSLFLAALLMVFLSTAFGSPQSARDDVNKQRVTDLRIVPGKPLIQGVNNIPVGPLGLLTYKLEEVTLNPPIKIQRLGKQQPIETAIRLTITGKSVWTARVIWIDDARLTGIWSDGPDKIGTLIYDRSILKPGATLFVQDVGGYLFAF
jgi:hypothetical protein